MNILDASCEMLETYTGRDKIIRTLCYTTKLVAGLYKNSDPNLSKSLGIFSSKMSAARATLRLLDDIPMLKYSIEFGLGKKEPSTSMAWMGVLANIIDHIYYPIDKICWLAEYNMITVKNPDKWDTLSSVCWVGSIYLNLMRTMKNVALMEQHKMCLHKLEKDSSGQLAMLIAKQRMDIISVIRITLDLTQAVSTLPKGYFWGGKFESWHVGMIGTLSSFIGLYQYFAKKALQS